jgi:hypothetical protein
MGRWQEGRSVCQQPLRTDLEVGMGDMGLDGEKGRGAKVGTGRHPDLEDGDQARALISPGAVGSQERDWPGCAESEEELEGSDGRQAGVMGRPGQGSSCRDRDEGRRELWQQLLFRSSWKGQHLASLPGAAKAMVIGPLLVSPASGAFSSPKAFWGWHRSPGP